MKKILKCPDCGRDTVDDPIGYSPPVAWCEHCKKVCEPPKKKESNKIYYCGRCDRYTDVRYVSDKNGGRAKSYCYKCSDEMLEPCDVKR